LASSRDATQQKVFGQDGYSNLEMGELGVLFSKVISNSDKIDFNDKQGMIFNSFIHFVF
jgi:hypothetical protein